MRLFLLRIIIFSLIIYFNLPFNQPAPLWQILPNLFTSIYGTSINLYLFVSLICPKTLLTLPLLNYLTYFNHKTCYHYQPWVNFIQIGLLTLVMTFAIANLFFVKVHLFLQNLHSLYLNLLHYIKSSLFSDAESKPAIILNTEYTYHNLIKSLLEKSLLHFNLHYKFITYYQGLSISKARVKLKESIKGSRATGLARDIAEQMKVASVKADLISSNTLNFEIRHSSAKYMLSNQPSIPDAGCIPLGLDIFGKIIWINMPQRLLIVGGKPVNRAKLINYIITNSGLDSIAFSPLPGGTPTGKNLQIYEKSETKRVLIELQTKAKEQMYNKNIIVIEDSELIQEKPAHDLVYSLFNAQNYQHFLIFSTDKPSTEANKKLIKNRFPHVIIFYLDSLADRQVIAAKDTGVESLIGSEDLIYLCPGHPPKRLHLLTEQ